MNGINILVGGDFCPLGRLNPLLAINQANPNSIVSELEPLTEVSDCFNVNLECPLTTRETARTKFGPVVKSGPAMASFLAGFGVDIVTLANNHIMDFGVEGLADTVEACKGAGIATVGAGLTFEEATRIHYRKIKGRKLAVINMAEREFSYGKPGCSGANPFDLVSAVESIREARGCADHVFHGGSENTDYPSPDSVLTLRFLAEQGPTAIIRHHPHWVQGHEVWKGILILYSLRNFLFDWHTPVTDMGWYEGILVNLTIDEKDGCALTVHPFEQCKGRAGLWMMDGPSKERFMNSYIGWSEVIGAFSQLQGGWHRGVEKRKVDYFGLLTLPHQLLVRVARRFGLLRFAQPSRMSRRVLENLIRCEAHREVLLDILKRDREDRYTQ